MFKSRIITCSIKHLCPPASAMKTQTHFTSPTHSPSPQVIPLSALLGSPGALRPYYPNWATSTSRFQMFPPSPTLHSGAEGWNPPNYSADPHLPQSPALSQGSLSSHFSSLDFVPKHSSFLLWYFWSPILHLPHHPGFLNLFFKPVWRASTAPSHLQLL